MLKMFASALQDERGATAIEYALIASLISVGVLSGVQALGASTLVNLYTVIGNAFTAVP